MSAAWESLHRAARELASADPIKQRLTNAFSKYLNELDPQALPKSVRGQYEELAERMTCVRPFRGETAVFATVRKMSNEEAGECAQRIVELLANVAAQETVTVRARPRQVVSLYSAEA